MLDILLKHWSPTLFSSIRVLVQYNCFSNVFSAYNKGPQASVERCYFFRCLMAGVCFCCKPFKKCFMRSLEYDNETMYQPNFDSQIKTT